MQTITLDLPPSLNSYYRHVGNRVLISADGRKYRRDVRDQVISQQVIPITEGRIWLHMLIERADKRRSDVDNVCKCGLDSLQGDDEWPGCYANDGQIDLLVLERGKQAKKAKIIVSFGPLDELGDGKVLSAIRPVVHAPLRHAA